MTITVISDPFVFSQAEKISEVAPLTLQIYVQPPLTQQFPTQNPPLIAPSPQPSSTSSVAEEEE